MDKLGSRGRGGAYDEFDEIRGWQPFAMDETAERPVLQPLARLGLPGPAWGDQGHAWSAVVGALFGAGTVLIIAGVFLLWKRPRKRETPMLAPLEVGHNDTLPAPPFEGVFEANDDSVRCPQWFNGENTGTLDCLHVNIHVPDSAGPDNLLPVMIYIYGGTFIIGAAGRYLSGPEYLIKHDVIFVSMGYRLGPYGFMCLDIPEVPGNQGLRDQEKAFQWIKDNIESFGGDVNRMTLFGNSAGGMAVGLHLISNTEKVYRNAILQSGSSLYIHLFRPRDLELPFRLAANLGMETDDVYEALNYLSTIHPHNLLAASMNVRAEYNTCVEKVFPGVTPFLPDFPLNLKHEHTEGMSIMQGFTTHEVLFAFSDEHLAPEVFFNELTLNGRFNFESETLAKAEALVRQFYIRDELINKDVMWEIIDFLSDFYFFFPATRLIPRYFEGGVEKVYQYVFSYDGGRNYGKILRGVELPGAVHADCIGYLFSMEYPLPEPVGEDLLILERMTAMWTNFAKYNDPTPEIIELLPVKWEPITQDSAENYLEINNPMTLGRAYQHQRMTFWKHFYDVFAKYELGYNYTVLGSAILQQNRQSRYLQDFKSLILQDLGICEISLF